MINFGCRCEMQMERRDILVSHPLKAVAPSNTIGRIGEPMSVKSSISLTDQQNEFVRTLVAEGRFASASAVIQQGLDLLRQQTDANAAETEALRVLLSERAGGAFVSADAMRRRTEAMIAEKQNARVAD